MSNRKRHATEAIRQIALREGITIDEIYRQMERAVETASRNPDPEAQRFWRMLAGSGRRPSPEDVILFAVEHLSDR